MTIDRDRGRTIREAVIAALDALPARGRDLEHDVIAAHVKLWVHDYAHRRGVLLDDRDIESELTALSSPTTETR